MKGKFLILICLILFIVSVSAVSAAEADVAQTDDLEISLDSNTENNVQEVDLDNGNELQENDDSSEKLESDPDVLAASNEDKLAGKTIIVENLTFNAIQTAINGAEDGDTISLKEGTYLNNGNGAIIIDKNNISIVGVKDSTILDAQKASRILHITATSGITIKDIVFINGNAISSAGGAIFVEAPVANFDIDATFINNTAATNGGANYFQGVINSTISGNYINNTAAYGGANRFDGIVSNSTISGTYSNNTANNGGANNFNAAVSNSTISGTYSNNTADVGGANYIYDAVSNSNISGTYNNNTAQKGGANYFSAAVSNSTISGTYNNNTAQKGGANYFSTTVSDSTISGTYINNKATNGTLYFRSNNARIINAIFVNNNCSYVIYAESSGAVASNNWFGNNATNYNVKPETKNVEMTSWLFLNATADPGEIEAGDSSKITFALLSYDETSGVGPYDASKMDVNLTLSQTLGELDKTSASLGEEILYTNKEGGNATITSKFETASYTLTVNVSLKDASVSVANSTLNLRIGDTHVINATTLPAGLNVTYLPDNSGVVSVDENGKITALKEGTTGIIVKVGGDGIYAENSTVVTVTVSKIPAEIAAPAVSTVYNVDKDLVITLKDADGKPVSGVDITVNLNGAKTYKTDANGQIKVNVAKLVPKTYTAKVTFSGDAKYLPTAKDVTVTVKKAKPKLTAKKKTFKKSKKVKKYSVTLKTNTNKALKKVKLTLKIKGKTYKAKTNAKGKATFKIKKLTKKGTYKATVTFKGNKYYNKVTKKVKIKIR